MNQQDLQKNLISLGLTDNEVKIYLCGLSNGIMGVAEIQKYTDVKRPTIYHCLNTLMEKGLAAKSGSQAKLKFSFASPEKIKRVVENQISTLQLQMKKLDEVIPELVKSFQVVSDGTKIEHYEGKQGIKTVVEEALYCKNGKWDIIAPEKNFFSDFDKDYAKYFMATRNSRGIITRSLWEKNPTRRILTAEEIKTRQPRFLPKVMQGKFKSVMILFDNKVAIISSAKELSAVLIVSQELKDFFGAMFEGLWSVSEPYNFK